MQNLFKTAAVITTLMLLAACGAKTSKDDGNKTIAEKKTQLEKLKGQQKEINDKVAALEEELIKLDPSLKKENMKLVALALIWAYLHHLIAGVRHLWMDATHAVTKEFGQSSAIVTLALSVLLTLALGYKLFF